MITPYRHLRSSWENVSENFEKNDPKFGKRFERWRSKFVLRVVSNRFRAPSAVTLMAFYFPENVSVCDHRRKMSTLRCNFSFSKYM